MTFGPHTITVVTMGWDGSTRDRQNNPVKSELATFAITGCFIQQLDTDEVLRAQESQVTRWVGIIPDPSPNAITAEDRIRVTATTIGVEADAGQSYATLELDGVPDYAYHVDGTLHHIEALLRRVTL